MSEVTFSSEQFEKLIEAIRPGNLLAAPTKPDDDVRDRSAAIEILRTCEQHSWGGETEFIKVVRELVKTKI